MNKRTAMDGVREYSEKMPVCLIVIEATEWEVENDWKVRGLGREVILAKNEGGYNCTQVDLLDLVGWLKANRPELLK